MPASPPSRALIRAFCYILFPITLLVFTSARIQNGTYDSQYTILTAESLLLNHTTALNAFPIRGLDPDTLAARSNFDGGPFYQLENIDGRVTYAFPNGGALLSLPPVALLYLLGVSAVDHGHYYLIGEVESQRIIASCLMAVLSCVLFTTAALQLPVSYGAFLALAASFGTQILSTAVLGLWGHTWEIFFDGWIVWLLLDAEVKHRPLRPILLATLLSWTYFVRPDAAIVIAATTVYVWRYYRSRFLTFTATGAAWFAGFCAYSWSVFGQLLPDYYQQGADLSLAHLYAGLPANLISPSRGLLVFVPMLVSLIVLVVGQWRRLEHRRLVWMALLIIVMRLLLASAYRKWWGGSSYGPRLMLPVIPWAFLLAVLATRAWLAGPRRRLMVAFGVATVALSIAINFRGAFDQATVEWNGRFQIDKNPAVVWDIRHPQFLAR
jgi:hypothetical protein